MIEGTHFATAEIATARLRRLRERAGLSMEALARQIGFRRASSYQRYENAALYRRNFFSPDFIEKLRPALVGKGDPPITDEEVLALGSLGKIKLRSIDE